MDTILNLRTPFGVIYMAFRPLLTADQYADVLKIVAASDRREQVEGSVRAMAAIDGFTVSFAEPSAGNS